MPTLPRHLAIFLCVTGVLCLPVPAQDEPAPTPPETAAEPPSPLRLLLDEIDRLQTVIDAMRAEVAEARLEAADSRRALEELDQFISDNEILGRDFEQYRAIKAIAERDARRRRAEEVRRQRQAEQAVRTARREVIRSQRQEQRAEFDRLRHYRDAGFTPLGFNVFMGNAAFFYNTTEGTRARIDWDGRIGHYFRLYPHYGTGQIDYSSMTVSGSVLNASDEVRHIGIAVALFDDNGSQVGGEIVQINNARPDVPYPFTTTIAMALNRPFATSSTYVLYADPADTE